MVHLEAGRVFIKSNVCFLLQQIYRKIASVIIMSSVNLITAPLYQIEAPSSQNKFYLLQLNAK